QLLERFDIGGRQDLSKAEAAMPVGAGKAGYDAARQLVIAKELHQDFLVKLAAWPVKHRLHVLDGPLDARHQALIAQEMRIERAPVPGACAARRLADVGEFEHGGAPLF